jgi:glycosyltransferase involved in cell wall biosynthesis
MSQTRSTRHRFLFVSALFTGNEAFFLNLRNAVSRREDVEATWMPIELDAQEWFARVPPISWNFSLKNAVIARARLSALERSGKVFDAAFINHVTPAYLLGSFMKRVPTIISLDVTPRLLDRYSVWYETGSPQSLRSPIDRLKLRLTRNVYRSATELMPWSLLAKGSLVTEYDIREDRVCVLPPGIDLNLWRNPQADGTHENHARPVRFLFVGGHFLRKGGDLLLKAAQRPEFQHCEFHFVTKTYEDPHIENVFVYANVSPNSESLRSLYRTSDVFAFPTRADFSPLAVCEAMAMGLPVVATDVGGLKEMVDDGVTGFIVPRDDETLLVDRLSRLRSDAGLRHSMGKNARKKAEEIFNLDRNAHVIIEHLKRASTNRVPS